MGRPPLDNPKSARLELRLLPDELDRWQKAAARCGESLSEWLRNLANERAAKPKGKG